MRFIIVLQCDTPESATILKEHKTNMVFDDLYMAQELAKKYCERFGNGYARVVAV